MWSSCGLTFSLWVLSWWTGTSRTEVYRCPWLCKCLCPGIICIIHRSALKGLWPAGHIRDIYTGKFQAAKKYISGSRDITTNFCSMSSMTFPEFSARMHMVAFLLSQIDTAKLTKSAASQQQLRQERHRLGEKLYVEHSKQENTSRCGLWGPWSARFKMTAHSSHWESMPAKWMVTFTECSSSHFFSTGLKWAHSNSYFGL